MSDEDEKRQTPNFYYRFLSTKVLLEKQELENQEIYFCPPDQIYSRKRILSRDRHPGVPAELREW